MSETGFVTAGIQRGGDITKYLNPLWTINLIRAIAIALIVFFAGPYIAKFYHAENLVLPIRFGGVFVLLYQLENIGQAFFSQNLDFQKIFIRNLIKTCVYAVVTVAAAMIWRSYLALFVGTIALYASEMISTYFLHPFRPRLSFAFRELKELTRYSKWVSGQIILDRTYGFLENSIIARSTNPHHMGLYTKAKTIGGIGPGFLSSAITMVSFVAYAKLKDEPEKIRDGLRKTFDVIFAFMIPAVALILIGGGKIILVFMGEAWLPMLGALRVFIIYFVLQSIVEISYRLFAGIGFPDKKVKLDTVKLLLTIGLLLFLTPRYVATGSALALLLGIVPTYVLSTHSLVRLTIATYADIYSRLIVPLLVTITLSIPVIILKPAIVALPPLLILLIASGIGSIYYSILYLLWRYAKLGPYPTAQLIIWYLRQKRD